MITFYLIRHGEAENNVRHILDSLPQAGEYHLTERGRERVASSAEFLVGEQPEMLYCSPILRTRETAAIIAEKTGLTPVIDERLAEIGFGAFNNGSQQEYRKKYPEPTMRFAPGEDDGTEGLMHLRARMQDFLKEMVAQNDGKKIVVVSHGDPLEQFHGLLTNEAIGLTAMGWYPEKGSCTIVEWQPGKRV